MTDVQQRWWHSFEEDHDDVRVYRPEGFDFPPARGRRGLELRPDGTCIEFTIGRGDAPEAGQQRTLEVVRREPDRLELRTDE